jgi:hypothetical protein
MKLKEARNLAINYCEENKCNYAYVSFDDLEGFYLTDKENQHTVFFINKNGSLNACRNTQYAVDFHKELKKRKKTRRNNDKRKTAEMLSRDNETDV